ncbi:MAG: CHAT domain-containing protein [Planctomycetota bacterium]
MLGVAFLAGPSACSKPPPEPAEATLTGVRARAVVDGAVMVRLDAETTPTVRVEGAEGPWRLEVSMPSGTHAYPTDRAETRDGGLLLWTRPPAPAPAAGSGTLRLVDPEDRVRATWPATWAPTPEAHPVVAQLAGWRKAGDPAQVVEWFGGDGPKSLDAEGRLWAPVERARAYMALGQLPAAVDAWVEAAETAKGQGVPSEASRRLRAAGYVCWRTRQVRRGLEVLERADAVDRRLGDVQGPVRAARHRAMLLMELGRSREAMAAFDRSEQTARRHGLHVEQGWARQQRAALLLVQGRYADALASFAADAADSAHASRPIASEEAAWTALNHAWASVHAMAAGAVPKDWARPRRGFERALVWFRKAGQPAEVANALANLALVAHLSGAPEDATRHLDALDALDPEGLGNQRLFALLLRGDIALEQAQPDAAVWFERAARVAEVESGGAPSDFRWRAWFGRARAAHAAGDVALAVRLGHAALTEIARVARATDLHQSRAPFFADRDGPYRTLASWLISAGRVGEAWAVADALSARVVRALVVDAQLGALSSARRTEWLRRREAWLERKAAFDAGAEAGELLTGVDRARWEAERETERQALGAALDAVYVWLDEHSESMAGPDTSGPLRPSLGPGEAVVTFTRLDDGWRAFLQLPGAGDPTTRTGEPADLLDTVRRAVLTSHARHLYVVGRLPGAAALAEALVEHASTSRIPYVGWLAGARRPPGGAPLVVGDPDDTLPHARTEAGSVAERLEGSTLLLGAMATRAATLDALGRADHLHFAGHGVLRPEWPWDAHLKLAGGQALALSDVLTARPRLGTVVLSGCETGRSTTLAGEESVGLPEAFLAAGARTVVATDRVVGDAEARAFVEAFYDAGGLATPGPAWQTAVRTLRDSGSTAWTAFHLVGRP